MKTTTRLLPATLATLALLTAACSSDPSTTDAAGDASATSTSVDSGGSALQSADTAEALGASSPGGGDPCRLLTSAEAQAVLGQSVREPVIVERDLQTGAMFDCAYNSVDQSAGPASVHAGVLGDTFNRGQWEQAEQADGLEPVSGIGGLAFYDSGSEKLDVFDNGRWIQIQIINPKNSADILTLLTNVARDALTRV
jgi:hypothetical protein